MGNEKSVFAELLGNSPVIRVLNHLLIFREFDYSLSDIARDSCVAWSTLNLIWPKLERLGVVVNTRLVGKAKMYKLNTDNTNVKKLVAFADALVWSYANSRLPKQQKRKVLMH